MTLLEFIRDEAPAKCGVHKSFGRVAELAWNAEMEGDKAFAQEAFASIRERAELGAPYPGGMSREEVVNVIELAICIHRQAHHGEDHAERIELLKATNISEEEIEMVAADWWIV